MKTNVTLSSKDRELFGVTIKQRTDNGFICVSDLQRAYEAARWENGWSDRKVNDVLSTTITKERIYYILLDKGLVNADMLGFMELVEKEGIVATLKNLNVWKTTGKGENRIVYCDPYLWVLLAMEMNPIIYAKVIVYLTDTLVFDRIQAGSEFLPMNTAIKNALPSTTNYGIYAIEINKKVFGYHQNCMRDLGGSKELKKIADIEKYITKALEMKFIKTHEQIILAIQNF